MHHIHVVHSNSNGLSMINAIDDRKMSDNRLLIANRLLGECIDGCCFTSPGCEISIVQAVLMIPLPFAGRQSIRLCSQMSYRRDGNDT